MEMKKFDQVLDGVGNGSLRAMQDKLISVNTHLADLGFSMEKVNESILGLLSSGVSWARSTSEVLARTTMELHGVTGAATSEITSMFSELIKKAKLSDETLKTSANVFVGYNQNVKQFKDLGPMSFANFKDAIMSSNNALLLAQRTSDIFAKNMMADLSSLSGMATALGMSVSEMNSKFEEAGSLIGSATSGFRDLLVISGGAQIGNLMTDQFNKTDSMLKMVGFLQDLNRQFGNNINITAQVAQQAWGLSKEQSLQLLNMTTQQQSHVRELQALMKSMDEDRVHKAYEGVTNNIVDTWEKVKASFMNVFERAVGGSHGLGKLQEALTHIVQKLQEAINGPTASKIMKFFENIFDSAGPWLGDIVNSIDKTLDKVMNNKKGVLHGMLEGILDVGRPIFDLLTEKIISAISIASDIFVAKLKGMLPDWLTGGLSQAESRALNSYGGPNIDQHTLEANRLREQNGSIWTQTLAGASAGGIAGGIAGAVGGAGIGGVPGYVLGGLIGGVGALAHVLWKNHTLEQQALAEEIKKGSQEQQAAQAKMFGGPTGEVLNQHIESLSRQIAKDKDQLGDFTSVGAKGDDLTYGRDSEGVVRFMSVAEKQFQLQEEIAAKQKEKDEEIAEHNKVMEDGARAQVEANERSKSQTGGQQSQQASNSAVSNQAGSHNLLAGNLAYASAATYGRTL
jgi:hypothetical protein